MRFKVYPTNLMQNYEDVELKDDVSRKLQQESWSVYLRLQQDAWGGVRLIACDNKGRRLHKGNILKIDSDGLLFKIPHLNDEIWLQVSGKDQKIKERKEL